MVNFDSDWPGESRSESGSLEFNKTESLHKLKLLFRVWLCGYTPQSVVSQQVSIVQAVSETVLLLLSFSSEVFFVYGQVGWTRFERILTSACANGCLGLRCCVSLRYQIIFIILLFKFFFILFFIILNIYYIIFYF